MALAIVLLVRRSRILDRSSSHLPPFDSMADQPLPGRRLRFWSHYLAIDLILSGGSNRGLVVVLGVGAIFSIGVGACLLVARATERPLFRPSLKRYAIFALIATLAYPLNLVVMVWGSTWFCAVCRLLFPSAPCHDQDPDLGLWFAAVGLLSLSPAHSG